MNDTCPFEPNVLDAAAGGRWTETLRAHLAGCDDCAAAAEVGPWMTSLASRDDREHVLPDPAVLWLKAKLLRSSAAADRAALPITRTQIAGYFILAAGWATLLTWKWSALVAWMTALNPGRIAASTGSAGATTLSITVLITVVLLASATAVLAFHTILDEE